MVVRVLHVLDKLSVDSGVSNAVMNWYNQLNHDILTFDFMVNEKPDEAIREKLEKHGAKIYIMPALKVVNLFAYIKALRSFYKTCSYQIIHGHVANSAVFYLGLAKTIPHRILHSHSTRSSDVWWKRIRNWFLVRPARLAANAYAACSEEAAIYLFGKNAPVTIIFNGIDADRFTFDETVRSETRSLLNVGVKTVIGHVGRFSAVKNHDFIIDVFYEVYQKNKNTCLLLIGNGELYGTIIRKIKNHKLEDAVALVEVTEKVGAYLNAMDVFILPSLFEGLGLVAIEAQAAGLRVIASEKVPTVINVGGNVEFLPLDKAAWVSELLDVQEDQSRGKKANPIRGSCFDIETQTKILSEYYERLLQMV